MRPKIHPGMTPEDLVAWRHSQPGEYEARNGEMRPGWSQEMAADWYGCSTRTWQRYEGGESAIPLPLVRRLQAHARSFDEALDRILDTTPAMLKAWGSPFEQLKDEDSEAKDITRPATQLAGVKKLQPIPEVDDDDDDE